MTLEENGESDSDEARDILNEKANLENRIMQLENMMDSCFNDFE